MGKELTSIRVSKDTVEILKKLKLQTWWVDLLSHDDKIKHLVWFYEKNINNNL